MYTDSGWMDGTGFLRYLSWVEAVLAGEPFGSVADSCCTYVTSLARDKAESHGMELCFGPVGKTGELQLLERGGFAILKTISQCVWDEKSVRNPEMR
jgi:hypothetical protein